MAGFRRRAASFGGAGLVALDLARDRGRAGHGGRGGRPGRNADAGGGGNPRFLDPRTGLGHLGPLAIPFRSSERSPDPSPPSTARCQSAGVASCGGCRCLPVASPDGRGNRRTRQAGTTRSPACAIARGPGMDPQVVGGSRGDGASPAPFPRGHAVDRASTREGRASQTSSPAACDALARRVRRGVALSGESSRHLPCGVRDGRVQPPRHSRIPQAGWSDVGTAVRCGCSSSHGRGVQRIHRAGIPYHGTSGEHPSAPSATAKHTVAPVVRGSDFDLRSSFRLERVFRRRHGYPAFLGVPPSRNHPRGQLGTCPGVVQPVFLVAVAGGGIATPVLPPRDPGGVGEPGSAGSRRGVEALAPWVRSPRTGTRPDRRAGPGRVPPVRGAGRPASPGLSGPAHPFARRSRRRMAGGLPRGSRSDAGRGGHHPPGGCRNPARGRRDGAGRTPGPAGRDPRRERRRRAGDAVFRQRGPELDHRLRPGPVPAGPCAGPGPVRDARGRESAVAHLGREEAEPTGHGRRHRVRTAAAGRGPGAVSTGLVGPGLPHAGTCSGCGWRHACPSYQGTRPRLDLSDPPPQIAAALR